MSEAVLNTWTTRQSSDPPLLYLDRDTTPVATPWMKASVGIIDPSTVASIVIIKLFMMLLCTRTIGTAEKALWCDGTKQDQS